MCLCVQKELTLEYILGDGMLIGVLPAKTAYVVNIEQGCVVTGVGWIILSCLAEVGDSKEESRVLVPKQLFRFLPASALEGRIVDFNPEKYF